MDLNQQWDRIARFADVCTELQKGTSPSVRTASIIGELKSELILLGRNDPRRALVRGRVNQAPRRAEFLEYLLENNNEHSHWTIVQACDELRETTSALKPELAADHLV